MAVRSSEGSAVSGALQVDEALRALVERAGRRDVDAFRELFERYRTRVYRYALLHLGRSDEAEDAVQDVFLVAWKGLPSFRYEHPGSFPGWLFRVARSVVADELRRRGRRRETLEEPAEAAAAEPDEGILSRRVLIDALRRLPELQREVLVLRFLVGLPAREVAAAIGKSEAAVTSLQVRALAGLRRHLGGLR
jgi:RNA polymerase sigma-70 factor (ECF subfamily)